MATFPLSLSPVSMRWRDLLFANWPVDPGVVAERLPRGVTVDTHDGDAFLGVVAFEMADIRPRGLPFGRAFGELNLRTYVRVDGRPAVYFFSIDSDDRIGSLLAGRLCGFPYYMADVEIEIEAGPEAAVTDARAADRNGDRDEDVAVSRGDDGSTGIEDSTNPNTAPETSRQRAQRHRTVRFRSRRRAGDPETVFDCRYRPTGSFSRPTVGAPEEYLLERYRFYVTARGGTYYADIDHEPWTLAPAEVTFRANSLFETAGFEPPGSEPLLHVGVPMSVVAGRPRRLR